MEFISSYCLAKVADQTYTYQRQNKMIIGSHFDQVLGFPGNYSVVLRQILPPTTQIGCPRCIAVFGCQGSIIQVKLRASMILL